MLIKIGDSGPAVTRIRELLRLTGGGPYNETDADNVRSWQRRHVLTPDGIVGPKTWRAAEVEAAGSGSPLLRLYDHALPTLADTRRCPVPVGVTVHQTGCQLAPNPGRWARVNAHVLVPRQGPAVALNPPGAWIWHAQGLSGHTLGLEVEGNFSGLESDPSTVWGGGEGDHLTDDQLAALAAGGPVWSYLDGVLPAEWTVYAHRQSSATRRADPGEEIWRYVTAQWGRERSRVSETFGDGRPVPDAWAGEGGY